MNDAPSPPKLPKQEPVEPLESNFDDLARQRQSLEARRRSRANLRIDSAMTTPDEPMSGLKIQ